MATAWNLRKVHETMNNQIKLDVNNIYNDLVAIDNAVNALMDTDQAATSKNGTTIANFSGHKAYKYFNVLKKKGGYFNNSENFYDAVYKLCLKIVDRGQQRGVKDNNSKYKSYYKWSQVLPSKKKYTFNHVINASVTEDVTNVSKNILTLKERLDNAYNKYIKDTQDLAIHLKTLKKFTPDGLDKKITTIINKIERRNTATKNRKEQLSNYISAVILNYLLENTKDENETTSVASGFSDESTQTID